MVVNGVRDRYRVDLIGLQAACEANYARLMRLLPEMREQPGPRQIAVTQGDQMLGVLTLEVILDCPYTSTLRVSQQHSLPWLPVPQLQVQVYHDARMAEVYTGTYRRTADGLVAPIDAESVGKADELLLPQSRKDAKEVNQKRGLIAAAFKSTFRTPLRLGAFA